MWRGVNLPRRWFKMSGLSRFGLFDGISKWFAAADSKCGPPELLAPAPTLPMKINKRFITLIDYQLNKIIKYKPPKAAVLGLDALCAVAAPVAASLKFCFEFDVVIVSAGIFSVADKKNVRKKREKKNPF